MKSVNAYLNFDGNCREAMTFYAKCLSAELETHPFSDMPGGCPPGMENRLMHARLFKGPVTIMASDTMPGMELHEGNNIHLTIAPESRTETDQLFAALGEGGTVIMPLGDQFWGAYFGMVKDRFGIQWMLNFEIPQG